MRATELRMGAQRSGGREPGTSSLRAPAAVILDLDGTLVETAGVRARAWRSAFSGTGLDVPYSVIANRIGMDGRRLAREVGGLAGRTLSDAEAEALDVGAGRIFDQLNTEPRPLAGACTLIDELERRRLPWAIATSSRPQQVLNSLRWMTAGVSALVVDSSGVTVAKPAPDLLLAAADQLGIAPGNCWAIGDSVWDVLAARAAGMVAIVVTAGSVAQDRDLRNAGPDLHLANLSELIPLFPPPRRAG